MFESAHYESAGLATPGEYQLHPNYPNPFNANTVIRYDVRADGLVALDVFDILGRKVQTLLQHYQTADRYETVWDGLDFHGKPVASGVYFYRLAIGKYMSSRKMTLLRLASRSLNMPEGRGYYG